MEQKNKGRAKVKLAVFFVLAIHGIGLLALLMQGCRKDEPAASTDQTTNTLAQPAFEPTNQVTDTSAPPVVTPSNAAVPAATEPPTLPGVATEYTIASGDSFSTIAKKYHVSVKAIMDANPGVEPTKLKLGQKIKIPPPTPVSTATTTTPVLANGEHIYTVKSGDNLITIAKNSGTTVKAIRAANNLKTDSIKVGQKLTIPAKTSTPAPDSSTPAPK